MSTSKTLYIHRHAKSSWDHSGLSDFDRPLNSRGQRDMPLMADRFVQRGESVDILLSSPANRAISTAHIMAKALGYPLSKILEVRGLYLPSINAILTAVGQIDQAYRSAMIFGHNPGFTDIIHYLCGEGPDNLPTSGIARIDFQFDDWRLLSAQTGNLVYVDFPKNEDEHGV